MNALQVEVVDHRNCLHLDNRSPLPKKRRIKVRPTVIVKAQWVDVACRPEH
jgi:hypothetical protein